MSGELRPRELLCALHDASVDFVLIGGLAGAMHGTTRVTQDIDIAYAGHAENAKRLCAVLNALEPHVVGFGGALSPIVLAAEYLKKHAVIHLATAFGRVDVLRSVDGFHSYASVKKFSELLPISERASVQVLSIAGLLKAKRFLKRPKDAQDIVELEAIEQARELDAVRDVFKEQR